MIEKGLFVQAIDFYTKAIQAHDVFLAQDKIIAAYLNRAGVFNLLNDHSKKMLDYHIVLTLDPNNAQAKKGLGIDSNVNNNLNQNIQNNKHQGAPVPVLPNWNKKRTRTEDDNDDDDVVDVGCDAGKDKDNKIIESHLETKFYKPS